MGFQTTGEEHRHNISRELESAHQRCHRLPLRSWLLVYLDSQHTWMMVDVSMFVNVIRIAPRHRLTPRCRPSNGRRIDSSRCTIGRTRLSLDREKSEAMESSNCCTSITEGGLTPSAAEAMATRFKALSEPARLRLVSLIASNGEMCVCDLTEPLGLTQPTVSHHLKVLTTAGFLHREQRGKWAYFSVDSTGLGHLAHSLLDDVLGAISA